MRKSLWIALCAYVLAQDATQTPNADATKAPNVDAPTVKFSPNPLSKITTSEKASVAQEKKQMLMPEYTSPKEPHNLCCGPIPKPKVSSFLPRTPEMVESLNPNCCGPVPQRALQGTLVAHGDDLIAAPPRAEGPVPQPPSYAPQPLAAVAPAPAVQVVKADISKFPVKPTSFLEMEEKLTVEALRTRLNALSHPSWL